MLEWYVNSNGKLVFNFDCSIPVANTFQSSYTINFQSTHAWISTHPLVLWHFGFLEKAEQAAILQIRRPCKEGRATHGNTTTCPVAWISSRHSFIHNSRLHVFWHSKSGEILFFKPAISCNFWYGHNTCCTLSLPWSRTLHVSSESLVFMCLCFTFIFMSFTRFPYVSNVPLAITHRDKSTWRDTLRRIREPCRVPRFQR